MGKHNNPTYPLRLEPELMDKVRIIAQKEDRPISYQLERIIREYVERYEKEQGKLSAELSVSKIG